MLALQYGGGAARARVGVRRSRRGYLPVVRASSCVERLASAMSQAHAAGVPFDRAWSTALRDATHGAPYVAALSETRDAWTRAYHGDPPTPGEVAAGRASRVVAGRQDDLGVGA